MHSLQRDQIPAGPALLTISMVSRLVGVPSPTIRSWERRYQLPVGERSAGGHRRYTTDDVRILTRMRDEVAAGRPAVDVAAAVQAAASTSPAVLVQALLQRSRELDSQAVAETLAAAREAYGLVPTVEEVVWPAMRELGGQWADSGCAIAEEHLLTATVETWLHQEEQAAPPPTRPGRVLLAGGPADLHTLGLRALGVLLARDGFDCLALGARTPADALRQAVQTTGARAVVVVSHLPQARPAAVAALQAAATCNANVYYAGGAFDSPRSRNAVPGSYLGGSLSAAAAQLADAAAVPRGAAAGKFKTD